MNQRAIVLALCGVFGVISLWAHHSLAAEYDTKKPVSLTGTVTKLDWRNPHAWVYLDVKNTVGETEKWQCELGSPNAMSRAGFSPEAVKPGDEISLDGLLAKDASKTCSTRVLKSKDGHVILSQTEAR
jgi:hypothetical protein